MVNGKTKASSARKFDDIMTLVLGSDKELDIKNAVKQLPADFLNLFATACDEIKRNEPDTEKQKLYKDHFATTVFLRMVTNVFATAGVGNAEYQKLGFEHLGDMMQKVSVDQTNGEETFHDDVKAALGKWRPAFKIFTKLLLEHGQAIESDPTKIGTDWNMSVIAEAKRIGIYPADADITQDMAQDMVEEARTHSSRWVSRNATTIQLRRAMLGQLIERQLVAKARTEQGQEDLNWTVDEWEGFNSVLESLFVPGEKHHGVGLDKAYRVLSDIVEGGGVPRPLRFLQLIQPDENALILGTDEAPEVHDEQGSLGGRRRSIRRAVCPTVG